MSWDEQTTLVLDGETATLSDLIIGADLLAHDRRLWLGDEPTAPGPSLGTDPDLLDQWKTALGPGW